MNFKRMNVGQVFGTVAGKVAVWLISAAFIWWGWNTFAKKNKKSQLEYTEVIAMQKALTYIMKIF